MALALLHHPFSVALSPKSLASHLDAAAFERAKAQGIKVPKFGQRLDTLPFLRHAGLLGEERSAAAVLDVRAPCEYEKGHVPGAVNFPLFDDAERRGGHAVQAGGPRRGGGARARARRPEAAVAARRAAAGGERGRRGPRLLQARRHALGRDRVAALAGAARRPAARRRVRRLPPVGVGGRVGGAREPARRARRADGLGQDRRPPRAPRDWRADHRPRGRCPPPRVGVCSTGCRRSRASKCTRTCWRCRGGALGRRAHLHRGRRRARRLVRRPRRAVAHMRHPKTPVLRMEIPRAARIDRLVAEYGRTASAR